MRGPARSRNPLRVLIEPRKGTVRAVELMPAIRFASSLLAPPRCAICSRPCDAAGAICRPCTAALGRSSPGSVEVAGLGLVYAAASHDGVARQLIGSLKFAGRTSLAEVAARALARALPSELEAGCVVAVPPARLRLRARGFDPAALLAAGLAARLELPLVAGLVRLDGRRQVGRRRADRVAEPPLIRARAPVPRPLLVDDVLTTGATLRACASALRRAGDEPVGAAVFARALGPERPAA